MKKNIKRVKRWVQEHTKSLIVSVIVVTGIGVGAYYGWNYYSQLPASEGELSEEEKREVAAFQEKKSEDISFREDVNKAIAANDTTAMEKVEGKIAAEKEAARQVELYIQLSSTYFDQGKVAESMAAAKKAEGLTEDKFLVADWLSRVYEYQHDYANAVRYYEMAAKHAGGAQNVTGLDRIHYENEAKRVKALLDNGVKS